MGEWAEKKSGLGVGKAARVESWGHIMASLKQCILSLYDCLWPKNRGQNLTHTGSHLRNKLYYILLS